MKISMVIPTYCRDNVLEWGLQSLSQQSGFEDMQVLVVNDGIVDRSEIFCKKYGVDYLFTGQRNSKKLEWRSGIVAINEGVSHLTGDILIISCAEMYYIGDCIPKLVAPVIQNGMAIGIPNGRDDRKRKYLANLEKTGKHDEAIWESCYLMHSKLPFLVALRREHFVAIGGYDTAFIPGRAYDDTDFMMRLLLHGCFYSRTEAKATHLFHDRKQPEKVIRSHDHNRNLFISRYGVECIKDFQT